MAVEMNHKCDFAETCVTPAPYPIELTHADVVYRADVCPEHRDDFLETIRALGFRPIASLVQGKRRDVHVTASGKPFTSAEAREWLVSNGLKTGTAQGRISSEHLQLYANAH